MTITTGRMSRWQRDAVIGTTRRSSPHDVHPASTRNCVERLAPCRQIERNPARRRSQRPRRLRQRSACSRARREFRRGDRAKCEAHRALAFCRLLRRVETADASPKLPFAPGNRTAAVQDRKKLLVGCGRDQRDRLGPDCQWRNDVRPGAEATADLYAGVAFQLPVEPDAAEVTMA